MFCKHINPKRLWLVIPMFFMIPYSVRILEISEHCFGIYQGNVIRGNERQNYRM